MSSSHKQKSQVNLSLIGGSRNGLNMFFVFAEVTCGERALVIMELLVMGGKGEKGDGVRDWNSCQSEQNVNSETQKSIKKKNGICISKYGNNPRNLRIEMLKFNVKKQNEGTEAIIAFHYNSIWMSFFDK